MFFVHHRCCLCVLHWTDQKLLTFCRSRCILERLFASMEVMGFQGLFHRLFLWNLSEIRVQLLRLRTVCRSILRCRCFIDFHNTYKNRSPLTG